MRDAWIVAVVGVVGRLDFHTRDGDGREHARDKGLYIVVAVPNKEHIPFVHLVIDSDVIDVAVLRMTRDADKASLDEASRGRDVGEIRRRIKLEIIKSCGILRSFRKDDAVRLIGKVTRVLLFKQRRYRIDGRVGVLNPAKAFKIGKEEGVISKDGSTDTGAKLVLS